MPSIKKVAEIAGVSVGTVSHVITGSVPVSEPLRLKVQAAIRDLNYHPNHVARSLKTNKTQTLGIIVPDMTISFFPQLIRGAETAARQRGYSLIAVNSDDDGERQKELLSLLRSQRVEGILLVIAAAPTPLNQLTRILDASIPMVCLDRIPDRVTGGFGFRGRRGRRGDGRRSPDRDGLPAHRHRDRRHRAQERTAAPSRIQAGADPMPASPVDEDLIWHGNFRPEDVNAICRARLCNPATRPDAVFCTNGPTALGVLRAFRDCGLKTPARYRLRHLRRTHRGRSLLSLDYHRRAARLRYRLSCRADPAGPHRRPGNGDRIHHRPPPRHPENPRLLPPARHRYLATSSTQRRRERGDKRRETQTNCYGFLCAYLCVLCVSLWKLPLSS